MKEKVLNVSGWMYDESMFPPDKSIYVVASRIEDIKNLMTDEEFSRFDRLCFVHDSHFFREFNMPKFNILFLQGWRNHFKSKAIDYDMINFAIKNSVKVIGYKGSNEGDYADLLDQASTQKELKMHGIIGEENAINSIMHHPEALVNQRSPIDPKNYM